MDQKKVLDRLGMRRLPIESPRRVINPSFNLGAPSREQLSARMALSWRKSQPSSTARASAARNTPQSVRNISKIRALGRHSPAPE
jgi:hypothetical protein